MTDKVSDGLSSTVSDKSNDNLDTKGKDVKSSQYVVNEELDDDIKVVEDKEADVTLKWYQENEAKAGELTPELEKRLTRNIYLKIFPVIFAVNFMLFLDKNAMGYSNLLGLWPDTGLTQAKYNNLQTIFYIGYLVSQIPSHYIFQRVRLSWYLTFVTFFWAFLQLIQLTANNFAHLAAIRFFSVFSKLESHLLSSILWQCGTLQMSRP